MTRDQNIGLEIRTVHNIVEAPHQGRMNVKMERVALWKKQLLKLKRKTSSQAKRKSMG